MSGRFTGTDKGNANLTIQDGSTPSDVFAYGVNTIEVSSGTLTDDGNGKVTITTGGGGGSGTVTQVATSGGLTGGPITTSGTISTTGVLEDLNTLGAPASDGQFIVATGAGAFTYESGATARTSLGLDSMAVQDSASVSISGGSITGLIGATTLTCPAPTVPNNPVPAPYNVQPTDYTIYLNSASNVNGVTFAGLQDGPEFNVINRTGGGVSIIPDTHVSPTLADTEARRYIFFNARTTGAGEELYELR